MSGANDKPRLSVGLAGELDAQAAAVALAGPRARGVGHRWMSFDTDKRRYALARPPLRMRAPSPAGAVGDVLRGCHGADALLAVVGAAGPTDETREQLRAARAYGVAQATGLIVIDTAAGDDIGDVEDIETELRLALVDAGFAGDDCVVVGGESGEDLCDALWTALDRGLVDVSRATTSQAVLHVDEAWGRAGSWHAVARVSGAPVEEDDEVDVADPVSGEIVRGRISDLRDGHSGARLAVAEPGVVVVFHVASALAIEGACEALVTAGEVVLASSLVVAFDDAARSLPRTGAALARFRLHVGHGSARVARIDGAAVTLVKSDLVAIAPRVDTPVTLVDDNGAVVASGVVMRTR